MTVTFSSMDSHTSPYTSFIGAKSSFRFDRNTLTLTTPLMSVPADLRIFDMFSSAAFWSISIAQYVVELVDFVIIEHTVCPLMSPWSLNSLSTPILPET